MSDPTLAPLIELLPQKPPFRFVDGLDVVEPLARVRGHVCFAAGHRVFENHLPGRPLVPGVILIEALAQLAGIAVIAERGLAVTGYLAAVDRIRFRRLIEPDERIDLAAELVTRHGSAARFAVTARVGDALACDGELTLGGMRPL